MSRMATFSSRVGLKGSRQPDQRDRNPKRRRHRGSPGDHPRPLPPRRGALHLRSDHRLWTWTLLSTALGGRERQPQGRQHDGRKGSAIQQKGTCHFLPHQQHAKMGIIRRQERRGKGGRCMMDRTGPKTSKQGRHPRRRRIGLNRSEGVGHLAQPLRRYRHQRP